MDSSCHGESSSLASQSMDKLSIFNNIHHEPEPLGSVTHNQEIDGSSTSLQIRSSARVSKKLRLDSHAAPVVSAASDKKDDDKSEKLEKSEKPEKGEKTDSKQNDAKPRRRSCELWSQEDKNMFFEALNEYGKDFDAIQHHLQTKARKKVVGENIIKNKDQVRHFYYRTWHKISKHLKFSDDLKNAAREVYGLVNYGEIRKRLGFCTEKIMCMKLNDLIYKGTVQIRIRGKTLRIKTPLCRALRRLNRLEECQDDLRLPARVTVELRPRSNEAWTRVQSTSQNPRIRTLLPLQRRLTSLLAYLNHRWRPPHLKHRDKLLEALGSSNSDLPSQDVEDKKKEKEPVLRVAPHPGVPICLPSVNLTEYLTTSTLCLSSYEQRYQTWQKDNVFPPIGMSKGGGKGCSSRKGGKRQRVDSSSDKKPVAVPEPPAVVQKDSVCPEIEFVNCGVTLNNVCDNKTGCSVTAQDQAAGTSGDIKVMAVNHTLPQQHQSGEGAGNTNVGAVPPADNAPVQKEEEDGKNEVTAPVSKVDQNEEAINRIRSGWTIEDANALTIGELYLMFGSDSKLRMEYWWENIPPDSVSVPPTGSAPQQRQTEGETVPGRQTNSVGEILQKLISIAKLNFRKARVVCPCGHMCGIINKPAMAQRRSMPNRTIVDDGPGSNQSSPQQVHPAMSVSVTALHDGVFRRPLLAPSQFKPLPKPSQVEAFKAQLDKFRPRYCNRRGRAVRPKNVLVQRMLPLLPKAPNGHAMVTLKVIPQTSQLSGEFMPIGHTVTATPRPSHSQPTPLLPRPTKNQHILPAASSTPAAVSSTNTGCLLMSSNNTTSLPDLGQDVNSVNIQQPLSSGLSSVAVGSCVDSGVGVRQMVGLVQNGSNMDLVNSSGVSVSESNTRTQMRMRTSSPDLNTPVASPPSISNLLDLSLPSTVGEDLTLTATTGNVLLDVPLQIPSAGVEPNFVGLLPSEGEVLQNSGTPPPSPTRILKEGENQWLNAEVADFSLSSFLGQLESPIKPSTSIPHAEDTRLCSDVEAQLQCLMSENSVDYMAKFAALAAQIASSDASSKK